MEPNLPAADPASELLAERYRILKPLGRGGMAAVFEAHDCVSERVVALKRLQLRGEANSYVERLFELEYHTLSQLAHPRIVEVYDYHADAQGVFYTMELLTGDDLRAHAPIAWRELCLRLCDIASALALLHSRRFVHRDLTPSNVRCTPDGHAKLFDFGSMTQFGRAKHVVGTPPCVAPEALNGEIIDGQTDLYALGTTAYYALTGHHAYPARRLEDLVDAWRVLPPPPSHLVPGIPAALDELIMALISLVPRARPPAAAEVIERLSAIGGFEAQETRVVGEAYLTKPSLVGREDALAALGHGLQRLIDGTGTGVVVHGGAGTGRSRLLDTCALEAKLLGAMVLRTDARDAGDRQWGAAAGLLRHLSEQTPELSASLLAKHATHLASVLFEPTPHADSDAPQAELPAAGRAEIQAELQQLLLALAAQRSVVLVVDDLDRVDEPSAALIALLANQARQHRMLVLASVESTGKRVESNPLQLMASVSEAWRIHDLDRTHTSQLVVSLFGDVPNVNLLADRMFRATGGNPARVMLTAQRLVRSGACRYAAGTWSLPDSWDEAMLSGASQESIDPSLGPRPMELAQALALSGLTSVSLEECRALSGHSDLRLVLTDVLALTASGIVTLDNAEVGLSRSSWQQLLLTGLTPTLLPTLHLRVANLFEQRPNARFRMIQHVLLAGYTERALDMLLAEGKVNRPLRIDDPARAFEYLQSLPDSWPDTYRALIAACGSLGRPVRERLDLELQLIGLSTLAARGARGVVLELAAQLRCDTGLDLIQALAADTPAAELVSRALQAAQQRYEATPERERGLPLLEALTALGQLVIQVIGMAGRTLDLELLEAMPSLAPLAGLSAALAVVQENLNTSIDMLSGRFDRSHQPYLDIAERLNAADGAGLGHTHRMHMRSAVLWAAGTIEAGMGQPRALLRADDIELNPLFAISALQLRTLFALSHGDTISAEQYRTQTELLLIQNCPPQFFRGTQLGRLMTAYAAVGDLLKLKQCVVDVEAMSREHATWRPVLHYGRGLYQALRGDHEHAQAELERGLAIMSAGRQMHWVDCAGAIVTTLVQQQLFQAAVTRGRELLATLEAAQLGAACSVWVPLALAESHTQQTDDALRHIHDAIDVLSADGGCGVLLGEAYEVRARIALRMADVAAFETYAAACGTQYRLGNHPALLARYARLLRVAVELGVGAPSNGRATSTNAEKTEELRATVATALDSAQGPAERAERALRLLSRVSQSDSGFLYLLHATGPKLAAQFGEPVTWPEIDSQVVSFLTQASANDQVTLTVQTAIAHSQYVWETSNAKRFTPLLLSHTHGQTLHVVGLALLAVQQADSPLVPVQLLQMLSRRLRDSEDAVTERTGKRAR